MTVDRSGCSRRLSLCFPASQNPRFTCFFNVQSQSVAWDSNIDRTTGRILNYVHSSYSITSVTKLLTWATVFCLTFIYLGGGICWASVFLFSTAPLKISTLTQLAAKFNNSFILSWRQSSCTGEAESVSSSWTSVAQMVSKFFILLKCSFAFIF